MPIIIPIKDLKNTSEVSALCHSSDEPVFVTKNGYGDLVIMSMDTFEKRSFLIEARQKIAEAEADLSDGKILDAKDLAADIKAKYGL